MFIRITTPEPSSCAPSAMCQESRWAVTIITFSGCSEPFISPITLFPVACSGLVYAVDEIASFTLLFSAIVFESFSASIVEIAIAGIFGAFGL